MGQYGRAIIVDTRTISEFEEIDGVWMFKIGNVHGVTEFFFQHNNFEEIAKFRDGVNDELERREQALLIREQALRG